MKNKLDIALAKKLNATAVLIALLLLVIDGLLVAFNVYSLLTYTIVLFSISVIYFIFAIVLVIKFKKSNGEK